jgi:nucleoside-diphosphate-sugar epimerase
MRVLITGVTGFVGSHLVSALHLKGYQVCAALRKASSQAYPFESLVTGEGGDGLEWLLKDIDAVIHCAGKAHMDRSVGEAEYHRVNGENTLKLARAAEKARVKKFIFLSSVRAQSGPWASSLITETDPPRPTDAYGRSKWQAEQELHQLDLDYVALRPVLIYGQGVKGNMASLLKLAHKPWPLPIKSLQAHRSLLAIENLIDAIEAILLWKEELRRPFLVSDEEKLTLAEMVTSLRAGWGRSPQLFSVPHKLLEIASTCLGQRQAFQRLSQPLIVKTDALKQLGWRPRLSTGQGLQQLARAAFPAS